MKTAVVVGHHKKDGGAYSPFLKTNEFDFYSKVAKKLNNVSVFYHDHNISGYTSRIKDTASRINEGGYDLVIELHFNAASPQANGCETLYYHKSLLGKQYATEFSRTVNLWTGIELRRENGLKPLKEGDRGYASVYYPSPATILIEPFFGSNESDCDKIQGVDNMVCIVQDFIDRLQ